MQDQREVPRLLKYGGVLSDVRGAPRQGSVAVLFAIYREQTGGPPLWQETQNVQLDGQGRFSVLLGSARGMPGEIFAANEARWLGVQVLADAEPEQARVLLVSVPYALKARDAETLGGRPASAYVLYESLPGGAAPGGMRLAGASAKDLDSGALSTTVAHTVNAIPKFSAPDVLADSLLFEQYSQAGFDAFGHAVGTEDVVRVGDGTGLPKRLEIAGRMVAEGFDVVGSVQSSVHILNTHPEGIGMQINATSQGTGFSNGIYATAETSNAIGIQATVFSPLVASVPGTDYTYSILGVNNNPEGAGLFGWNRYNGGAGDTLPTLTGPVGVYASVAHSSGTAAVFDQRSGSGNILSARSSGTEVVSVTSAGDITTSGDVVATGTVTATGGFSGSGAGLTGVTASSAAVLATDPTDCGTDAFATAIDSSGNLTCAQPSSSNLADGSNLAKLSGGNSFVGTQSVTGDVSLSGVLTGVTGVFVGSTAPGTRLVRVTQSGVSAAGIQGIATNTGGGSVGVKGEATATSGTNFGVFGLSASSGGVGVLGSNTASTGNVVGVHGHTLSFNGTGVFGTNISTSGATRAVAGEIASAGGIAAQFDNTAGGQLLSARTGPSRTEVFRVDGTGLVTATAFSGDGSSLTGIAASTASALASDPLDCSGSSFAVAISAAGNLTCSQPGAADLTDGSDLARLSGGNSFAGNQAIAGHLSGTTAEFSTSSASANQAVLISRSAGAGAALTVNNTNGNGPAIYATSDDEDSAAISAGVGSNGGTAFIADVNSPNPSVGVYSWVIGNTAHISGVFAANNTQILSGRRGPDPEDEVFRVNEYGNVHLTGPYALLSLQPIGGFKASALQSNASGVALQFDDSGMFALQALPAASLAAPEGQTGTNIFTVDASGNAVATGSVTATSFIGSGAALTGISSSNVTCTSCVSVSELAFDPATQAELDAHKSSGDHDASYVLKTGDTMTGGLSLPSDGLVAGTNQLVLASGNVGIGTATPNMKLRIDNAADQGGLYLSQTNTTSSQNALEVYATGTASQNALVVGSRVAGAEPYINGLFVKTNGNVGIGTASPSTKLDVVGTMRVGNIVAQSTGKLILGGYDNGLGSGTGLEFNAVEQGYDFQTHNGTWGSRMVITDVGRVGIGTTTPTQVLDVVGNAVVSGTVTASSFSGPASGLACTTCVSVGELDFDPATQAELDSHKASSDHDSRYVLKAGDTMTGALNLPTDGLIAGTNQLALASGNVGVNRVPSGYSLDVAGEVRSSSDMVIGPGTDKTLWFNVNTPTTNTRGKVAFLFDGSNNNMDMAALSHSGISLEERAKVRVSQGNYIRFDTDKVERARIDGSGNFGIGTSSPTTKLHVVGDITTSGTLNASAVTASSLNVSTLNSSTDIVIGPGTDKTLWFNVNTPTTHTRGKVAFLFDGSNNNVDMAALSHSGISLEERAKVRVSQGNYIRFDTDQVERARIDGSGNFGIGTSSPATKLHVAGAVTANGVIESTSGGVKFPDGTTQTSAASSGELIVVTAEEFDEGALPSAFSSATTADGSVTVSGGQLLLQTGGGGAASATVSGTRQFAIGTGTLLFKGRIAAYVDGGIYGNFQPRGLANGTDRNNAIEFITASPTSVKARTVSGGVATETTVALGETVYNYGHYYQIVATSTRVKFYINGALVATHTTNIPSSALNILFATTDGGFGNVPIYVNNVSFERRE